MDVAIQWYLLQWFVSVLTVYRLAYLMTLDTGPFAIFHKIREAVINKYGVDSWQAEGAGCPLCQSVWYAFIAACLFPWMGLQWFLLTWGSVAGAALIIHWRVYIK
jgi:hypothetical protein